MITLATLPTATAQEVFDQVAKHLLTQMSKSIDIESEHGWCQYRGHYGLSCAAGCLIADEEYKPEMEGKGWDDLAHECIVPDAHDRLISDLQGVHDCSEPEMWRHALLRKADEFGLDKSVLI